jgi:hypothetical protein
MAKILCNTPRPLTFEIGKPNFPKINLSTQAPFHEFIGPRSSTSKTTHADDDEEQRQFLLQVLKDHGKNNPSLLKKN